MRKRDTIYILLSESRLHNTEFASIAYQILLLLFPLAAHLKVILLLKYISILIQMTDLTSKVL